MGIKYSMEGFIKYFKINKKCIKCLGFSHARDAVYGTSKCKICGDFHLITLRSRLEDYERESSIFPRRASSTSAAPREIAALVDVELEEMESEQTGLAFSLPPSPERARANSPVEFLHDFLFPSPKARDFVSFGLDDVLHTAASDSEDFGPALADALPPSGQEARPSAAYSELVDVLSRATEKLALDWPDEPRESRASPSPYDHDGRINDRLGRGLRRQTGERGVEGRVPLLSYKLPGTQGCLPGFEVFSPHCWGVSYHSQDGQYGGCVPHKPPRRFKVAHPGQACASSSPLVPRQVPLFEGGSRFGSTEPGGWFSVETEAQAGGMDVEPSDGIPDLGSVWQSGGGPLCFSRVIPVPALVLPEFPDDSGHRCVRPPMAECQSVRVSANKADTGSTMQSEGERCPSPSHSPILALPDLVLGANSPLVSASLGDSDQAGLTVPASGQDLASSTGALEVVGMAHTGPRAVIDGMPAKVQETIASARAPATRKLYSSKWGVFESWCLTRAIDPVNCPVGPLLEFLQERLTAGAAAITLRVYVAAIAARRELDEIPLGRHRMVSAFMRGVRRLRPVRPTAVPSWDLSVVLEGLVMAPFEPLESASERILTLKVVILLALTSLKRVGDLQAFSVSEMCMDFAPGLVKVTLRPRPGYIPKVLSTSFRSQVVTLHSFHPPPFASSEDERLHLLCPVRALKLYVDPSKVWRKSPKLLICFGAGRRGLATSKQRISHWVRDAISLAYEARNLPSPLSLRAHSTRGVASSQALFRGVPLEDICVAAGWSSPHTFVKFYNLDVDTAPGFQILSVWTDRMLLVHYWAR